MATQTQLRRGTAAQNNSFTGAVGELSYDTENKSVRVHDGSTAGGIKVITEAHTGSMSITTSDNLSGLIVASTDADAGVGPTVQLFRNSSSPADNDLAGNLLFVAENDASEATVYANIGAHLQDVTNGTEDGKFFINTMIAGAEKSRMFMPATETVFNEESADIDFRVESNGNANMLFVDGGNNRVGVGTNAPVGTFVVEATVPKIQATTGSKHLEFGVGGSGCGLVMTDGHFMTFNHQPFANRGTDTNLTERMRIDSTGAVTMPAQPAFQVTPSSGQLNVPINATQTVVFGTEIFDQNADFASNTFTAPVTGKYQFNTHLRIDNWDVSANYYQLYIITSNRNYISTWDAALHASTDQDYITLTLSTLADMDASDTARVGILQSAGAAQSDISPQSTFSGYLVA